MDGKQVWVGTGISTVEGGPHEWVGIDLASGPDVSVAMFCKNGRWGELVQTEKLSDGRMRYVVDFDGERITFVGLEVQADGR